MKIKISDRVGSAAVDYDEGQALLDEVLPPLVKGEIVHLDFAGVEVFASPFFNGSVAILSNEFDRDVLNERLVFENMSADGHVVARTSIENAKSLNDPDRQKRLAEALADDEE